MIQLSPSAPGSTGFGGGASTGMATGRTANFGYGSLGGGGVKPMRGPMQMGAKNTAAPAQLLPDQPIGIQPAQSSAPQQKSGGGGGGLLGRGMSFLKGIGEGGGGAAAGGAEAAGGADAIAELAPLALAAV